MAIGVDTSKWKPRKLNGTPAGSYGNRVAFGIIGVGIICGFIFHYTSVTKNLRTASENFYEDPIEVVEFKRIMGSGLSTRTGDNIRKLIEKESRPDLPYK